VSAQKPLTVTDDFDSSTITERFSHDPRCSERPLFETSYVCFVLSMERPTFVGHPFLLDPNHRKEPHNKIKIIALFKYRGVTNGIPRYPVLGMSYAWSAQRYSSRFDRQNRFRAAPHKRGKGYRKILFLPIGDRKVFACQQYFR